MIARAKLLLVVLVAITATCATTSAVATDDAPMPAVRSKAPPGASMDRIASSSLPDLCSLADGRWCTACGETGEPECPQGDSGALCCLDGHCVIWTGGDCKGDLGWCENYTTSTGPGGITEATCWD